jgi:hypothetical protein
MGSSSGKAPNVVGAAAEQGEQALQLNREQTAANRPDQYNPWGSSTWQQSSVINPATGRPETRWTQTEKLAEPLQQSLDSQMRIGAGRAGLAEGAMARAWGDYSDPMNFDQFGDPEAFNYDPTAGRQHAEDAAYQRQVNRLDPMFASQQRDLETKLRNQGLAPGDQAYDAAMKNFGMTRNDAYEQARLGSSAEGRTEAGQLFSQATQQNQIANALRTQRINEALGKRGFNLSEVERLLQGQQISGGPPASGGGTAAVNMAPKSVDVNNLLGG